MLKDSSTKFTKITNKYLNEIKKLKIAYIKELFKTYAISEGSYTIYDSMSGDYIKIDLPNESYQMNWRDSLCIYGGECENFLGVSMFNINENSIQHLKSYAINSKRD